MLNGPKTMLKRMTSGFTGLPCFFLNEPLAAEIWEKYKIQDTKNMSIAGNGFSLFFCFRVISRLLPNSMHSTANEEKRNCPPLGLLRLACQKKACPKRFILG